MPLRAATCIWVLLVSLAPRTAAVQGDGPPSRELLRELTETARLAGTTGAYVGARNVARRLEEAGWRAEIEPREVLLSYPRRIEFAIHDGAGAPPLRERVESFDPDAIPPGDVPIYNAWSASGSVRGRVVDAGRGLRPDFERLRAAGVDLAGTVALCRYGGSYRGVKVDLAAQYGCAAVLLWSDPASDGAGRGPTWPAGPWKNPYEAQRGSISPIGRVPGDPSTPGWASPRPGEGAPRVTGAELEAALPRILCLPIGAAEADLLRARLAPRGFLDKDGQPLEQATGPGPVEVRLAIHSPRELRTIWNVIGTLPGASDEFVLAGAHRDAWVRGANDAGSGTVAVLRAAQRLGQRVRDGWTPPRTLRVAFWDAEEFGLIGSTEWAEAHAREIEQLCTAYLNCDVAVSGTRLRGLSGSPGLLGTAADVLRRVPTPEPRDAGAPATLWDDWLAHLPAGREPGLGLPGSGSDFAAFLHHLSVPVLDLGLSGNGGGQYHTAFDDVAIVERHLDPGYVGHELCARMIEELMVEFAARGHAAFDGPEAARALAGEADALAAEPGAGAELAQAARELAADLRATADVLAGVPQRGARFLRALSDPAGIPGREWFRNVLWTPGLEDGYGSETFPTLRAAAGDAAGLARARRAIAGRLAALRAAAAGG